MSHAPEFDTAGPGLSNLTKVFVTWGDPDFYELGRVADSYLPWQKPGRHQYYPSAVHLLSITGAHIFGGAPEYFRTIWEPGIWQRLRMIAKDVGDLDLPEEPPDPQGIRNFLQLIAPRRPKDTPAADWFRVPEPIAALIATQAKLGALRATQLVGRRIETEFDPLHPDLCRLLILDGSVTKAFSRVGYVEVSDDLRILLRSRARDGEPRVQPLVRIVTKDGRTLAGINHVAAMVDTPPGWIITGATRALLGENVAMLDLIERTFNNAPGLLGGVLTDRAMDGWSSARVMRRLGLMAYHLPTAEQETHETELAARLTAQDLLQQLGIAVGENSIATKGVAKWLLDGAITDHDPLPLGTSTYRNSKGERVFVASTPIPLDVYRHHTSDEESHAHMLYVDGDSLHEVVWLAGELHKVQQLRCVAAKLRGSRSEGFALRSAWRLDCPYGPVRRRLKWQPSARDCRPRRSTVSDYQRALEQLAVVSRGVDAPSMVLGWRSRIESLFSRYDASQARGGGFATYLHPDHQLLEFMLHGQVVNSITNHYSRFDIDDLFATTPPMRLVC